jgi:hypothetical protein
MCNRLMFDQNLKQSSRKPLNPRNQRFHPQSFLFALRNKLVVGEILCGPLDQLAAFLADIETLSYMEGV